MLSRRVITQSALQGEFVMAGLIFMVSLISILVMVGLIFAFMVRLASSPDYQEGDAVVAPAAGSHLDEDESTAISKS